MENDTQVSIDLKFNLELPYLMKEAAAYTAATRGYDENVLFADSRGHVYSKALALVSSVFRGAIKMVHYDGELLHIFLNKEFTRPQLTVLRRVFDSKSYLPDTCLNDILTDAQAIFSLREQVGTDLHQTNFTTVTSYEGPVDVSYLHPVMAERGLDPKTTVAVVLNVVELNTVVYHDSTTVDTYIVPASGDPVCVDFFDVASRMHRDPLYTSRELVKIERHFNKTKFKAGNNARR